MKLQKLTVTDKNVYFEVLLLNERSHEELVKLTAHEQPKPGLYTSLNEMRSVVCRVMQHDQAEEIEPYGLIIKRSSKGTRSVQIQYRRKLLTVNKTQSTVTVFMKIDDPIDGEHGECDITMSERELFNVFLTESIDYVKGERLQALLPFEDPEAEPNKGEKIPQPGLFKDEDQPSTEAPSNNDNEPTGPADEA